MCAGQGGAPGKEVRAFPKRKQMPREEKFLVYNFTGRHLGLSLEGEREG